MKIEIVNSNYGIGFEMIIPISEFNKALRNINAFEVLKFAIISFTDTQGAVLEFSKELYNAIRKLLPKTGNVIFVIKESETRRYNPPRWCEIYAISNNVPRQILFSDNDGLELYLNTLEDKYE